MVPRVGVEVPWALRVKLRGSNHKVGEKTLRVQVLQRKSQQPFSVKESQEYELRCGPWVVLSALSPSQGIVLAWWQTSCEHLCFP